MDSSGYVALQEAKQGCGSCLRLQQTANMSRACKGVAKPHAYFWPRHLQGTRRNSVQSSCREGCMLRPGDGHGLTCLPKVERLSADEPREKATRRAKLVGVSGKTCPPSNGCGSLRGHQGDSSVQLKREDLLLLSVRRSLAGCGRPLTGFQQADEEGVCVSLAELC